MRIFLLAICLAFIVPVWAEAELSPEALENWFESDNQAHPYIDHISEGELHFLPEPPDKRVPAMVNEITILVTSVETGWVDIHQCHEDIDPVTAVEVVYRYRKMRNLKINSTENIKKARVEGLSVQLEEVGHEASLCVSLQARILYKDGERRFALRNGPFERRFLDGYYPLHVQLNVHYPIDKLHFTGSKPVAAPGFTVRQTDASVFVDAWFEGKLMTELLFEIADE
jgi:hypothetical protein